jgi:hypothetical protein
MYVVNGIKCVMELFATSSNFENLYVYSLEKLIFLCEIQKLFAFLDIINLFLRILLRLHLLLTKPLNLCKLKKNKFDMCTS